MCVEVTDNHSSFMIDVNLSIFDENMRENEFYIFFPSDLDILLILDLHHHSLA